MCTSVLPSIIYALLRIKYFICLCFDKLISKQNKIKKLVQANRFLFSTRKVCIIVLSSTEYTT